MLVTLTLRCGVSPRNIPQDSDGWDSWQDVAQAARYRVRYLLETIFSVMSSFELGWPMQDQQPTSSLKVRAGHAYTANSRASYLMSLSLTPKRLMAELKGVEPDLASAGAAASDESKGPNSRMVVMIVVLLALGAYLYLGS